MPLPLPLRPVRVNGDGNLVLFHQFVERVEAIGSGVRAERLDPQRRAEFEALLVLVLVFVIARVVYIKVSVVKWVRIMINFNFN